MPGLCLLIVVQSDTSHFALPSFHVAGLVLNFNPPPFPTWSIAGQTGTGKTYTMTGGDLAQGSAEMTDSAGVIPRAIHQVFSYLESLGAQEFTVKASYLELYNEEVTDLLALGSEPPKVEKKGGGGGTGVMAHIGLLYGV